MTMPINNPVNVDAKWSNQSNLYLSKLQITTKLLVFCSMQQLWPDKSFQSRWWSQFLLLVYAMLKYSLPMYVDSMIKQSVVNHECNQDNFPFTLLNPLEAFQRYLFFEIGHSVVFLCFRWSMHSIYNDIVDKLPEPWNGMRFL